MIEKLEQIDEILSSFEDWMHGIDGANCTKARELLIQLKNEVKNSKPVLCDMKGEQTAIEYLLVELSKTIKSVPAHTWVRVSDIITNSRVMEDRQKREAMYWTAKMVIGKMDDGKISEINDEIENYLK
jgi:hypothetical protein